MGFVIGVVSSVKRKVEFKLPSDDGKPAQKADFVVTLKVRDADTTKARRTELQHFVAEYSAELRKASTDPDYVPSIDPNALDEGYLHEDVEDIKGLLDEAGNEIEFSSDSLNAVLNDIAARNALFTVWRELNLSDAGSAKRKN